MTTEFETIKGMAIRMRAALESIPTTDLPVSMAEFPKGFCGDAALLLGAYFVDCGIEGFRYVSGRRVRKAANNWTSHAWLARKTFVVDISADQFWDAPGPVIVADPSLWHGRWKIDDDPMPADFREWHGASIDGLRHLYNRIQAQLKSQSSKS